jgi:hypothetical protein
MRCQAVTQTKTAVSEHLKGNRVDKPVTAVPGIVPRAAGCSGDGICCHYNSMSKLLYGEPINDYKPFFANFVFGVKVCSECFIGMELVCAIPKSIKYGYYRAIQINGLPIFIVASSAAVEWPMVEMGSDMRQSPIGPIEGFPTGGPI